MQLTRKRKVALLTISLIALLAVLFCSIVGIILVAKHRSSDGKSDKETAYPEITADLYTPSTSDIRILDRDGKLLYENTSKYERVKLEDVSDELLWALYYSDYDNSDNFNENIAKNVAATILNNYAVDKNMRYTVLDYTDYAKVVSEEFTEDEITEIWLNNIRFLDTTGIQAISQKYYHKGCRNLTAEEAILLVSSIQQSYALTLTKENLDKTGNQIISRYEFLLNTLINKGVVPSSMNTNVTKDAITDLVILDGNEIPQYYRYLVQEASILGDENGFDIYKLANESLEIQTSISFSQQSLLEEYINMNQGKNLLPTNADYLYLLTINPSTGEIIATGSTDKVASPITSPGMLASTFVYALGIDNDEITLKDTVADEPYTVASTNYTPKNEDGKYLGEITIGEALAKSRAVPAVKTLVEKVGFESFSNFLQSIDLSENASDIGPGSAIGGLSVDVTKLAYAYGMIANGGNYYEGTMILSIKDSQRNVIYKHNSESGTRLLKEQTTKDINSTLEMSNGSIQDTSGKGMIINWTKEGQYLTLAIVGQFDENVSYANHDVYYPIDVQGWVDSYLNDSRGE